MEKRGQVNVYTCPVGHRTVTGNLADGVTPFMIGCKAHDCKMEAKSSFYRVDQSQMPSWAWCAGPVSREWAEANVDAAIRKWGENVPVEARAAIVEATLKEHNENGVMWLRKAQPVDLETFGFYTRTA